MILNRRRFLTISAATTLALATPLAARPVRLRQWHGVALGAAAKAVETAAQYARERVQFGRTLIEHQGLGFVIADLATGLANARAILADAVRMLERTRERRPDLLGENPPASGPSGDPGGSPGAGAS